MSKLTNKLFQTYSNESEVIRIDILFNNIFNFFYFETYENDVLIKGNTRIVNNYENEHLKFSSLRADYASFEMVETFTLEFKND
ncbi:MAG: hypothetical protein COB61_005730 [Thiotrichales bacterium]|nr:hypothetical protein [Thiotrichales bacterium]